MLEVCPENRPESNDELFGPLRELLGDAADDAIPRLYEVFRQSAVERVEEACSANASGDQTALRRVMHTLKSQAAGIGAARLADIAAEIEAEIVAALPKPGGYTAARGAIAIARLREQLAAVDRAARRVCPMTEHIG